MTHRIVLVCERCERVNEKLYRSVMRQLNSFGVDAVRIETESPVVPGTEYELRLVGLYPGYNENHPCSSDMLSFATTESLKAIDWIKHSEEKARKEGRL